MRMNVPSGWNRRFWWAVALLFGAWLVAAWGVGPWLVRRAYNKESFDFLNRVISGRDVHPVEFYLNQLARAAWLITAVFVLGGAAIFLFRRRLARGAAQVLAWFRTGSMVPGRHLLAWCVGWGLVLGLAEVIVVGIRERMFGLPSWYTSGEIIWMAPVAAGTAFAVIGICLSIVSRWLPGLRSVRAVNLLLAGLAAFALVRLGMTSVHPAAAILLAVGVGFQVGRAASRIPQRLIARAWMLTLFLASLVGAGAVLHHGRLMLTERRALAALPALSADAPNVLLIVLDTVRAQNLSLYGYERETTPALKRFAAEGTTFDRAIAPSSWTLPSHASLFTGRYPSELNVTWDVPIDNNPLTLADMLTARGYASAGFVANNSYGAERFGLNQGFLRWEDHPISWSMVVQNEWITRQTVTWLYDVIGRKKQLVRKPGAQIRRDFLRWLDDQSGRPFFAFLNYFDAHEPYGPNESFSGPFSEPGIRLWDHDYDWGQRFSREELQALRGSYDSTIHYLDGELERLFSELAARGILDRTLVIITSDHGEAFGEHDPRLVGHGGSLYIQTLHVPLVLRYPGVVPARTRISSPVSLVDVPATVVDLTGHQKAMSFPGRSLAGFWREPQGSMNFASAPRSELTQRPARLMKPYLPVARGDMASVVVDSLHYIKTGDKDEALFDLAVDPQERRDLLKAPQVLQDVNVLRQLVVAKNPR